MNSKVKGSICGIVAAISYGTNPLGALFLYDLGIKANSVLFYRFSIAAVLLGLFMLLQNKSFKVSRKELAILGALGAMFAVSSLSLFTSFYYMDAGVASTILFVYPVMVAVIMAIFFKEKISLITILSIILALGGIGLLYQGNGGATLSTVGVLLVMLSALTYALYIIVINKSTLRMSSIKLTFYVLLFCTTSIVIYSFIGDNKGIQLLSTPAMWSYALMLALIPSVVSLVLMVIAVHEIGSTPTAIMGALEPLTAVIIGVTIFGELFTPRLGVGIMMILFAVILIIAGKSFRVVHLVGVIGYVGKAIKKTWRWK